MYEYLHGGNAAFEHNGEKILDLSANINPLGFPKEIEKAIKNEIHFCDRYSDNYSTELRNKIALYENIDSKWIFCGNGASDIIFRLPIALRSKSVLVTAPTFSDYERSSKSFGSNLAYQYLEESENFVADRKILDIVKKYNSDLIFICNPNNPTGVMTERSIIEELLIYGKKNNANIVVDECFMDFAENSEIYTAKKLLPLYDNLIILKAFTKIFALPGIRLGYALCGNQATIEKLYAHGPDWAVSNIAQAAGIAALENAEEYIKNTIEYVSAERQKMQNALTEMKFKLFDSRANYIFFHNPHDFDLYKELNKKGIRIRSCDNYRGLSSGFYRTAVSKSADNEKLISALKEIYILNH